LAREAVNRLLHDRFVSGSSGRDRAIARDPDGAGLGGQQRTGNSGWVDMPGALILFAGIPPLKARMLRSRGQRYRDHQSRASAFFPLPPQNGVVT
jgi:hypothetical protein